MKRHKTIAIAAMLAFALLSPAQETKEKDKKQEQPISKIRVCVALSQNTSTRSFTPVWQRTRLVEALNHAKPPKKAPDQRRIEATALPSESGAGDGDDHVCDYIVRTTVSQLQRAGDLDQPQDVTRMPPITLGSADSRPNDPQPLTRARVDFTLMKGGTALVDSYVTTQERGTEDAVVTTLLDRIAQRVNSEVHQPPRAWRE